MLQSLKFDIYNLLCWNQIVLFGFPIRKPTIPLLTTYLMQNLFV